MKTSLKVKLVALGLMLSATLLSAQVTNTYTYNLSPNANIPDGNPNGILQPINVSGAEGAMLNIQISLDLAGGYNGDLFAYLTGPEGQTAFLLNRTGVVSGDPFGFADAGFNITLDDSGGNPNIHDYGFGGYSVNGSGQVMGIWGSDGRNIDPQSDPNAFEGGGAFEGADTSANLTVFQNGNANGTWNLYIADLVPGGGAASLNNVSLIVTTTAVPEPSTLALTTIGVISLLGWRKRFPFPAITLERCGK
jgi:subtilisin-like proprotein convertase family protein